MPQSLSHLAIFGGRPASTETLHVGRPNIVDRERILERIGQILDSGRLTNCGPNVLEFERRIAGLLKVPHCVVTNSGTMALEIIVKALGLRGEVIVPSFSFIATAHALQWQGIKPVFCDVDPLTHTLDAHRVEARITPRTSGILATHTWGRACDIEALQAIAERHGLTLIFDAAHAFGCSHAGTPIGGFGRAEAFSFHATKFLTTFEGGAITTHDAELAKRMRLLKNFGFRGMDDVGFIGTNGKMHEVSAVMGLTGLDHMHELIESNRCCYKTYWNTLEGLPGTHLYSYDESENNNFQYVVLEIDERESGIHRDQVMQVLHAENVLARRYFYPGCHRMEPYRVTDSDAPAALPETERLVERVLQLPTGVSMTADRIERIGGLLRLVCRHAGEISRRLPRISNPALQTGQ